MCRVAQKIVVLHIFKASVNIYHSIGRNISENFNLSQHSCQNLKSQTAIPLKQVVYNNVLVFECAEGSVEKTHRTETARRRHYAEQNFPVRKIPPWSPIVNHD